MKISAGKYPVPAIVLPKRAERFISSFSELSSWQYRLLCGGASVGIQSGIESRNKDVDETTRKFSTNRTAVKLTIGTISGVITRFVAEKAGSFWIEKNVKKIDPKLTGKRIEHYTFGKFRPDIKILKQGLAANPDFIKKLPKSFGNILALGATIVTALTVEPAMTDNILNKIMRKSHDKSV